MLGRISEKAKMAIYVTDWENMNRFIIVYETLSNLPHFLNSNLPVLEKIAFKFAVLFFMEFEFHKKISKFFYKTRVSWKTQILN